MTRGRRRGKLRTKVVAGVLVQACVERAEIAAAHEGAAHAMLEHPHGLSITLTLPECGTRDLVTVG